MAGGDRQNIRLQETVINFCCGFHKSRVERCGWTFGSYYTPAPAQGWKGARENAMKDPTDIGGGCRGNGTGLRESVGFTLALMSNRDQSCAIHRLVGGNHNHRGRQHRARQGHETIDGGEDCDIPIGESLSQYAGSWEMSTGR
jgi:hypothetical protein